MMRASRAATALIMPETAVTRNTGASANCMPWVMPDESKVRTMGLRTKGKNRKPPTARLSTAILEPPAHRSLHRSPQCSPVHHRLHRRARHGGGGGGSPPPPPPPPPPPGVGGETPDPNPPHPRPPTHPPPT